MESSSWSTSAVVAGEPPFHALRAGAADTADHGEHPLLACRGRPARNCQVEKKKTAAPNPAFITLGRPRGNSTGEALMEDAAR